MQLRDGNLLLSPTDLVTFLGCTHATVLDYRKLSQPRQPRAFSESDQLLARKGLEHEAAFLQALTDAGRKVVRISEGPSLSERVQLTEEALRGGAEVVYQAALVVETWGGFADFLVRTDRPSRLGPFSYEVLDTKFARRAKPEHLIQLGVYSDLLAVLQDLPPDETHVVLEGSRERFRVRDFGAYVRHARPRLEEFVRQTPSNSYPVPCHHCAHCHWHDRCAQQWEDDDHLSLVANMHRAHAEKLERHGITSLTLLANVPKDARVAGLNPDVFQ